MPHFVLRPFRFQIFAHEIIQRVGGGGNVYAQKIK